MKKTEQDWVFAGLEALMESGSGAVRVERLAKRLKVTKGSFYHHYATRESLLQAMRESWALRATTAIMERVEAADGTSAEKLRRLLQEIFTSTSFDDLEASMRNWGAIDEETARLLQKMDDTRIRYVEDLLKGAGLTSRMARNRAQIFYRVIVGDFASRKERGPLDRDAEQDLGDLLLLGASSLPQEAVLSAASPLPAASSVDEQSSLVPSETPKGSPVLEVVDAEEVRPLRAAILRPMQPYSASRYPQDAEEDAFHVAIRVQRRWVGSASAFQERMNPQVQVRAVQEGLRLGEQAWRMRGVAVEPVFRGAGFGRMLVEKLEKELSSRVPTGATFYLWANARTSALPFYQSIGYHVVGDVFELPDIGPHQTILRAFDSI